MEDVYTVVISQKGEGYYPSEIVGHFTDLEEAQDFMKIVIKNFSRTKVSISYKEETESEDNE